MSRPEPVGRFLWYELLTTDRQAAADFYCSVMGWTTETRETGDEPYLMWLNGEHPLAGAMELPEEAQRGGAPPHWLAYVGVVDVDESTARAVEIGGSVLLAPMDIPDVGRIAVLTDPPGAPFAVYAPRKVMESPERPPAVGEFSWHDLATEDWRAALEFYGDLFGWEATDALDMGDAGIYQMFGLDGVTFGGMYADAGRPPSWLVYGRVDDLERALERVREGGGEAPSDPMEVPGGDLIAECVDPQGAVFALHQKVESGAATGGDGDLPESAARTVG